MCVCGVGVTLLIDVCKCIQAKVYFSGSRSKLIIVVLTLCALTVEAIVLVCELLTDSLVTKFIDTIIFYIVVPVSILVINIIVVVRLHRPSNDLHHHHHHHQSSPVPTVMLLVTSLTYAFICATASTLWVVYRLTEAAAMYDSVNFTQALLTIVYAYNFYVYIITGRQFRAQLRALFTRCSSLPHHCVVAESSDA